MSGREGLHSVRARRSRPLCPARPCTVQGNDRIRGWEGGAQGWNSTSEHGGGGGGRQGACAVCCGSLFVIDMQHLCMFNGCNLMGLGISLHLRSHRHNLQRKLIHHLQQVPPAYVIIIIIISDNAFPKIYPLRKCLRVHYSAINYWNCSVA